MKKCLFIFLLAAFFTTGLAQTENQPPFAFVDSGTLELDYLDIQRGFVVRVVNTSTQNQNIFGLQARIFPIDGSVHSDLAILDYTDAACINNKKITCSYVLSKKRIEPYTPKRFDSTGDEIICPCIEGQTINLPTAGDSNVFRFTKRQGAAVPFYGIKLLMLVTDTKGNAIRRVIKINPPPEPGKAAPFSFSETSPLEIDWNTLKNGIQIRVENNSTAPINYLTARIKPINEFNNDILKILQIEKEERCTDSKTVCGFVVGRLIQLRPARSNTFKLRATKNIQPPTNPLKFVLTVNDDQFNVRTRLVIIKPPAASVIQIAQSTKTIRFDVYSLFGLFTPTTETKLMPKNLVQLLCPNGIQSKETCVKNNQISGVSSTNGDLQNVVFQDVVFQKTDGDGQEIRAELKWDKTSTSVRLEFQSEKQQVFEVGDYSAQVLQIRSLYADGKPFLLKLVIRSHWVITAVLVIIGLIFATFIRYLLGLGTPTQRLLRRVDDARQNFEMAHGTRRENYHHDYRPLMRSGASSLREQIQKFRQEQLHGITSNLTYARLEQRVKIYESYKNNWLQLMGGLDTLAAANYVMPHLLQVNNFLGFNRDLQTVTDAVGAAGLTLTPRPDPSTQLNQIKRVVLVSVPFIAFCTGIYLSFPEASILTIPIVVFSYFLTLWIYSGLVRNMSWYWHIISEWLRGNSAIKIYWWDTFPVFVALCVATFNGFMEFNSKTLTNLVFDQLSIVVWALGSATAVSSFFTIIEKSPFAKYF
ncbi:MAG: hypothetical protein RLZZ156_2186 [Deinococcota bacterium]|jgi:hypothetical protein